MTENASAPTDAPDAAPDTGTADAAVDLAAEAEKWKSLAQKHEARAKANATAAKELEDLRRSSLSDAEKAVAEAEKRGETNALTRIGSRLVDAELRLATAGRSLTTDAVLAFDRAAFLTEDGDVNRDELAKWVEKHSVAADQKPSVARFGDADLGVRNSPPPADKSERDVARALFGTP